MMKGEDLLPQGVRIAVTGCRGFLGRHLVAALRSLRAQWIAIEGDVRYPETWSGDFDVVFHLASSMPGQFSHNPEKGFSTNVGGTLQALEACRIRGARMVFASTCGVYSPKVVSPISEDHLVSPQSPYAQSKYMAEMLCHSYADNFGVSCVILRLFNVYGPGQKAEFLIPYLLHSAVEKVEAVVNNPDSTRDFVYVEDVVRALLRAVSHKFGRRVINIGSGKAYSIRQVVDALSQILQAPVKWRTGKCSETHPSVFANIGCAAKQLGWSPRIGMEQGLKLLCEKYDGV